MTEQVVPDEKKLEVLQQELTALAVTYHETEWEIGAKLTEAKPLVAKVGRSGGWSKFCDDIGIPLSTADGMVKRYATTVGKVPEQFRQAITDSGVSLYGDKAQAALEEQLPLMKAILATNQDEKVIAGFAETVASNIAEACKRVKPEKGGEKPESLDVLTGKLAGAAYAERPDLARRFSKAFAQRLATAKKPVRDEVEQASIIRHVMLPAFQEWPSPVDVHIATEQKVEVPPPVK